MKNNTVATLCMAILTCLACSSCSSDDEPMNVVQVVNEPDPVAVPDPVVPDPIAPDPNPNPIGAVAGSIELFNASLTANNYILVNDSGNNFVYLMDKDAKVLHQWNLGEDGDLGNDCFLRPDGKLLAMLTADDPQLLLGGFGGKVQLLDKEGRVDWSFEFSSDDHILHHDAETLPNGNIVLMTWERKSATDAVQQGYQLEVELFPDGLIEVDPATNEIVWEWHLWDHMVQDYDTAVANYGEVASNPHLIDINYNQREDGDISHANGISYDALNDVIFLSANFYSEVWVIDHSTTPEESNSHSGGNYGKGGDLIYRFGNPKAYDNPEGGRLFHNNHYPNLLSGNDTGKMLIFSNGDPVLKQSTVYELQLPNSYSLKANTNNEPQVVWRYTHPELYSPKVSGAVRLSNGNTMITEGADASIWEVTSTGELVWKLTGEGFFWRAYSFDKTAPEILSLEL